MTKAVPAAGRTRGRPNSCAAMLDAAAAVVLKQGVAKLTLDAVAKEAGASKGGVMYNFPSKSALLTALVERLIEDNAHAAVTAAARMRRSPTRLLRAYVKNSVDDPQGDDRISAALLASVANEPALVERMRAFIARRFAETTQGLDFERAAIVHLATEGLWFLELLQISPFSPRQRGKLARRLLQMADASASALKSA